MSNQDFPYDSPKYWGIGTGTYLSEGKATMWAGKTEYTIAGFFGSVNYAWKNMLFAAASVRHEGCSKFGTDRKWGTFPSVSVAWEIAEMPFMQQASDVVQSIKPRISYGETGRCDFDPYLTLVTYSPTNNNYLIDGEWVPGYNPTNNSNPLLAWEKATSLNIGVDFMFWNRLRGSVEYFDRRSKDLLYTYTAPQPPYIYNDIMVNVGTIKNYGVEALADRRHSCQPAIHILHYRELRLRPDQDDQALERHLQGRIRGPLPEGGHGYDRILLPRGRGWQGRTVLRLRGRRT